VFGSGGTIRLMPLEVRKPGELVAHFNYSMPADAYLVFPVRYLRREIGSNSLLIWLKEETVFTVIYHRNVFVLGSLLRRELDMSKNPGLKSSCS
jgi:hypothetical protein